MQPNELPYYRPNQKAIQDMNAEYSSRYDGEAEEINKFSFHQEGDRARYVLRIMPPFNQSGDFSFTTRNHWEIPGNVSKKGKPKPIKCLEMWKHTLGVSCPICGVVAAIKQFVPEADIREGRLATRGDLNVIDRDEQYRTGTTIVRLADIPMGVLNKIGAMLSDPVFFDALHPMIGSDLEVVRSGKGFGSRYDVRFICQSSSNPTEQIPFQSPLLPVDRSGQVSMDAIKEVMARSYDLHKRNRLPYADEFAEVWGWAQKLRETLCNKYNIAASQVPIPVYPFSQPGTLPACIQTRDRRGDGRQGGPPAPNSTGGFVPPSGAGYFKPATPATPAPTPVTSPAPVPVLHPTAPASPQVSAPMGYSHYGTPPVAVPVTAPSGTANPYPPVGMPQAANHVGGYPRVGTPVPPDGVGISPAASNAKASVEASHHFRGEKPSCLGGAQPHPDGRRGFINGRDECMICPFEPECVQLFPPQR